MAVRSQWDREFESVFLQRGVKCEPDFPVVPKLNSSPPGYRDPPSLGTGSAPDFPSEI
jgi:hypothetical protein